LGDHAPIAHEHDASQAKALPGRCDDRGEAGRVGGVAGEDLDRQWQSAPCRHDPVLHLTRASLAVSRVAEAGELVLRGLHVRGGQVVAHDGILGEVTPNECPLDGVLAFEQPVHRTVGTVGVDVGDAEVHAERGVSEPRDRSGLGGACEHLGHDESERDGALAAGRTEQLLKSEAPSQADHGGAVCVAQRAGDPDGCARWHEPLAAQDLADRLERCWWAGARDRQGSRS